MNRLINEYAEQIRREQVLEYEKELSYLQKISPTQYRINLGFVPNMNVPADIIVNSELEQLLLTELKEAITARFGSFTSEKNKQHFSNKEKDGDGQIENTIDDKKKEGDDKNGEHIPTESNSSVKGNKETEATSTTTSSLDRRSSS